MGWFLRKKKKETEAKALELFSERLKNKCKDVFGENLISSTLFGGSEEGKKDFQIKGATILLVFKKIDLETFPKIRTLFIDFASKNNLLPMIVEENELFDVASCYPAVFLAAKSRNNILYGKDMLKELIVSAEDHPLKTTRDIMNLLLRGRHNLALLGHKPRKLTEILVADISQCINALRAMISV